MWGSRDGMATDDGTRVAPAERVGRKKWTVEWDCGRRRGLTFRVLIVATSRPTDRSRHAGPSTAVGGRWNVVA